MASRTALPAAPPRASSLAGRYAGVRSQTLAICRGLSPEDMMVQSPVEGQPDASPAKWHLAHTTWFFETFLLDGHFAGYRSAHPDFRFLFNSYYHTVGARPQRDLRGAISRPALEEVLAYRERVDEAMHELLTRELSDELFHLVELGLNHEQQHQELLVTDTKHALWSNPLRPAWKQAGNQSELRGPGRSTGEPLSSPMNWARFSEGVYEVGHRGEGFCFDNEQPRHKVYLQGFEVASRLITNFEYMAFVEDGGYRRPELWLSEGWEAVQQRGWKLPLYWERNDREWLHFTCAGMQPVVLEEPVCHLSYFEAEAFARWAGARLLTENEWEVAAEQGRSGGNFLESGAWRPLAAPGIAEDDHAHELEQLFGDCWEWTSSAYSPYPGYRPVAGAVGEYNGKFMVNQYVLRGGSCATPRTHIRASYRNFFPTHARWQFSGIRLARDAR